MTDEKAQLIDSISKMSIGTVCVIALCLALYLQHRSITQQQIIQDNFYTDLETIFREQNVLEKDMVIILKDISKQVTLGH